MYHILALDTDTHHDRDMVICRSSERESWILMAFDNDCMVMTRSGLRRAHQNDCFIKSPDFIEHHYTPEDAPEGFINDWVHLVSDEMEQAVEELNLPVNELFSVQQPLIMRSYLSKIMQERNARLPFWQQKCSNLIESMLIRLAKAHYEQEQQGSMGYEEEMVRLRSMMWEHPEKEWTVERMAAEAGLSRSRFSVLYKKRFGKSPNEDLIEMRIEKAKIFLLSTNSGLYEIARNCGFQNEFYFSRTFKAHEKISPGAYRQKI